MHAILRPFLLRRLKKDVEKQLPTKTEYIIKCQLSRRQKYLYDEFISREVTKKNMKSNDFIGLMNVLMQLRKVCSHPDLFEPRSIEAPLIAPKILFNFSSFFIFEFSNYKKIPLKALIFV